jgi:hypothetical protein
MAVGDGGAWHYQSIMTQKHHRDFFQSLTGRLMFTAAAVIVLHFFAFTYVGNL